MKENVTSLLPAWFTHRMMNDHWVFALLTTSGTTICIENIKNIYQAVDGTIWIDVTLIDPNKILIDDMEKGLVAPTSRTTASINTTHIIAAYELADT